MERAWRRRYGSAGGAAIALVTLSACSAILGIHEPEVDGSLVVPREDASQTDRDATADRALLDEDARGDGPSNDATFEPGPPFSDDFNRPDGGPGNGWIEKTPGTFAITGNRLTVAKAAPTFLNDALFRPFSEAVRDVEVSVAFSLPALPPSVLQVHARVPESSITTAGISEGYGALVPMATSFRIVRQRTSGTIELGTVDLTEVLNTTDSYRLRLRVSGAYPVAVEGWLERMTNGGGFIVLGHLVATDTDMLQSWGQAGTVSLAADTNANVSYDDFSRK